MLVTILLALLGVILTGMHTYHHFITIPWGFVLEFSSMILRLAIERKQMATQKLLLVLVITSCFQL